MKTLTLVVFCISLMFLAVLLAPQQLVEPVSAKVKAQRSLQQKPQQRPQVEPQARGGFVRIFQCDQPDRGGLRSDGGLVLERPEDPRDYRLPRIVLTNTSGAKIVYEVQSASWFYFPNPLTESNTVRTTFKAMTRVLGVNPSAFDFELQSNGSFQPLSGIINPADPNSKITFKTCGRQTTSAYYWTRSSQNKVEAFACPALGKPKGCPGIGRN